MVIEFGKVWLVQQIPFDPFLIEFESLLARPAAKTEFILFAYNLRAGYLLPLDFLYPRTSVAAAMFCTHAIFGPRMIVTPDKDRKSQGREVLLAFLIWWDNGGALCEE